MQIRTAKSFFMLPSPFSLPPKAYCVAVDSDSTLCTPSANFKQHTCRDATHSRRNSDHDGCFFCKEKYTHTKNQQTPCEQIENEIVLLHFCVSALSVCTITSLFLCKMRSVHKGYMLTLLPFGTYCLRFSHISVRNT